MSRKVKVCFLIGCLLQISAAQSTASKASAVQAHLQQAEAALKSNALEVAEQEFRAILVLDPNNAEAHANLGVIAISKGDYQNAEKDLRSALATAPALAKAQALLGICESRLGKPSAQTLLENSFSKLKDVRLRTQVGIELAGSYYEKGNLDGSASVIRTLVGLNPENVEILFMAQRVYSELADDTMNKLAIVAPESVRMQQVIAEHLINAGDLKGAIEHYRRALEINPRIPGVRYELAEAILESDPANSAIQDEVEKELNTVIATEGDSAKVQCELGRVESLRFNQEEAYAHYNRAYSLNRNDSEAQIGLGKVLMAMQKPREAIQYLQMAVRSDPLNDTTHYQLGLAYRNLSMTDEAQKEIRLYQEIKQARDQVKRLYRQMNRRPTPEDEQTATTK